MFDEFGPSAPNPSGMAQIINQTSDGAKVKPSKAPAVIKQLTNVTFPVPNRLSTVPLAKLEIIVPPAIVIKSPESANHYFIPDP